MTRRLPIIRIGFVGEHTDEKEGVVPEHYTAQIVDPGPHKLRDLTDDLYPSAKGGEPDEAAENLLALLQMPSAQVVNAQGKGLKRLSNKAAMENIKSELADFDPFQQQPDMIASDIASLEQGDEQSDEVIDLYTVKKGSYYTSKVTGEKRNGKGQAVEMLAAELPELMTQLREAQQSKAAEKAAMEEMKPKKKKRSKGGSSPSPSDPNSRTVSDLSEEFGIPGTKIRRALRKMYSEDPELAHEHRSRWVWDISNPSEEEEWRKVRGNLGG